MQFTDQTPHLQIFTTMFCFFGGILSAVACFMLVVDLYTWIKQGPKKPNKKGCAQ